MDWFDQMSEVIVSWGHRYLVEVASAVIFLVLVHVFIYPIVLARSAAATKQANQPQAAGGTTITTGAITTTGNNSGVSVGVPPPTQNEGKNK